MKKIYFAPTCNVTEIDLQDVITTSVLTNGGTASTVDLSLDWNKSEGWN